MPLDLGIVIVTYNSAHVVGDLLDSLPRALDGLIADVVVVDNDSQDDTCRVVSARPECRLVRAPNAGYAAGINRGVEELPPHVHVLVLNPDVRMHPGSVRRMIEVLAQPGTGIVAPKVVGGDGRLVLSLRREPTLSRALGFGGTRHPALSEYVTDPSAYETEQSSDWALGAVLLVRRECHDALGGWDESFFLYSEETDFCLRAGDAGWTTRYTPLAVATHIGGQSGTSHRIHSMQILNRVRLFRRRHGVVASLAYHVLSALSEMSWIARGHAQSWASVRALLLPRTRPAELGCADTFIPR